MSQLESTDGEQVEYEVITTSGLRWRVQAKDDKELDTFIDRGVIIDAKDGLGGSSGGWRVNALCIEAYRVAQ